MGSQELVETAEQLAHLSGGNHLQTSRFNVFAMPVVCITNHEVKCALRNWLTEITAVWVAQDHMNLLPDASTVIQDKLLYGEETLLAVQSVMPVVCT